MGSVTALKGAFSVKAYAGDFKTLLAFNLGKPQAVNLAGFTIACQPGQQQPYYLQNELQFQNPGDHAQDPKEPPNSTINAPIHKFRWLHVPGSVHQGMQPFVGLYSYTVTPRYFDEKQSLQPLDANLSVTVKITVAPFEKAGLTLGFTRGFTQSQAFVHHFGLKALIRPTGKQLLFDTTATSGRDASGQNYTFQEEYAWLGSTAREKIFAILDEVNADKTLQLDVCAYDLNEPDVMKAFLKMAPQGRIRIILDNASLHHSTAKPKPEDQFEKLFRKALRGKSAMLRGKFGRYAHDKVFIVSKKQTGVPVKVLTGSTNFSVTGLYVNSNHVLIFNDPQVAGKYQEMFQVAWADELKKPAFTKSSIAGKPVNFSSKATPSTQISFAPHVPDVATTILGDLAKRIDQESGKGKTAGSVLFAVMQIDKGVSPVYKALTALHKKQNIFSYGISDSPGGICLYAPGKKTGVLVTGKPIRTQLPPPFNQIPNIGGVGHQVHHKFVVCGFNSSAPVVYCGSSNMAVGGEEENGDNLIAIHDGDVAVAFALEALALVDHFNFLDHYAKGSKGALQRPVADQRQGAIAAHWYLSTNDKWASPYFDSNDLHYVDRNLFG